MPTTYRKRATRKGSMSAMGATETPAPTTNADVYGRVQAKIVAAMEKGVVPWTQGYDKSRANAGAVSMPCNAITRRSYNGINVLALWMEQSEKGYTSQGWVTFNQAKANGMMVRKGEKATPVILMRKISVKDKDAKAQPNDRKSIFLARLFMVFNLCQLKDLEDGSGVVAKHMQRLREPVKMKKGQRELTPIEACEAVIAETGATIMVGAQPCYDPAFDRIEMPAFRSYHGETEYYATMFHELAHWTGHKSRLDRLSILPDKQTYAKEELVAELSAAFSCARLGIEHITRAASYLKGWLGALKNDPKFLANAASHASKATDFIMGADVGDVVDGEEEGDDNA